jgi:hypothetical protein
MTASAAKSAREVAVVSKAELTEIAEWEQKYADAKKKTSAAEKELALLRIRLAEKVLGVKTSDELKRMAPDQVDRRMRKRFADGDWELGRGAPQFSFVKTNQGAYPAWAQVFADELGEAAAQQIRSNTPITYSYAVEVHVD